MKVRQVRPDLVGRTMLSGNTAVLVSLCHSLPVLTGRKKQAPRSSVNLETGKTVKIKVGLTLARQSQMSSPQGFFFFSCFYSKAKSNLAPSGGGKKN